MQAIVFDEFGPPEVLRVAEAPQPELRATDLLVRVHAAGVNRADLFHREGRYGRADFGDSSLMGLEIAGEVLAVGKQAEGFAPGDRVMGIVGGGAYAEVARIDHQMALRVPAGLDYAHAAAVPEVFVTAHEALFHLGRLVADETVLVHAAAGGVGSAAVQLARAAGARVLATASGNKHGAVLALGAHQAIDHRSEDFLEVALAATAGQGVDVVVDFIGAPYLERNVRVLRNGGRLVQVGIMGGGADARLPLDRVLFGHLQILGTVMKSRSQAEKRAMTRRFGERWLAQLGTGALKPVVDSVFPLARAADAHRRMESNANVGKIVLAIAPD